jgi:hypothetical protein
MQTLNDANALTWANLLSPKSLNVLVKNCFSLAAKSVDAFLIRSQSESEEYRWPTEVHSLSGAFKLGLPFFPTGGIINSQKDA